MSNTEIWDRLSRTDPKHTKPFKRAGGFEGKAVKPIYTDQKMTDLFGPCGIGWGISEPSYQLVNGPDGEVAVFCWLSIWFKDPATGEKSDPIPGIGGDFVVVKNKYGLKADDEAFKKASTDAIGNAMKHLGMSADVHMGQHDDDKYVTALRRELAEEVAPEADREPPRTDEWMEWGKERAAEYRDAPTLDDLEFGIKRNIADMGKCATQAPKVHKRLLDIIAHRRSDLGQAPTQGKAA
jgi:hypothetical protein